MITLTETSDMSIVKEIATHDDIWSRFSDGVKKEDYKPKNDDCNQWLIINCETEVAGIIRAECESTCAIGFHPYMYKKYRRYAREMIYQFFDWFLTLPEQFIKINIRIPECYKSTINTGFKTGFKKEGIIRDSYALAGAIYDEVISGITREEIINVVAK